MKKIQTALCVLLAPALLVLARPATRGGPQTIELDEAEVFIEFNHTDGDFGIQFFWDGDPWDHMNVEGPDGRSVLTVVARRSVQEQGLTEGFFESAEPSKKVLPMEEFLARFPEGTYEFSGESLEGEVLVGEAEFTHVIPAPPQNLWPADGARVRARTPLIVSFEPVTEDLDGEPLVPELYEIVVESDNDILRVFSIVLEGDTPNPAVTVPPEFLLAGSDYKFEAIVQAEGGNRTISEIRFSTP
jgi:hypothetical protein